MYRITHYHAILADLEEHHHALNVPLASKITFHLENTPREGDIN
jgi:hypothetical protein